jgi:hypothetical protein
MCKTFGVPARKAYIEVLGQESGSRTWLEIYSDGEWIPMYPDDPDAFGDPGFIELGRPHNVTVVSVSAAFTNQQVTSRYTDTGIVTLSFMRNGEPVNDFEHFTVSAWNDGAWLPLDDIWYDPEQVIDEDSDGFEVILGDGFYVVQAGVRNPRGDAYVQNRPVLVNAGETIDMTFSIDIPASESELVDLIARRIDPLPDVDLNYSYPDSEALPFTDAVAQDGYTCVMIFDESLEPSVRMVPLVTEWAGSNGIHLIGIGVATTETAAEFWAAHAGSSESQAPFFSDTEGTITEAFGITPNDEGIYVRLPFVMLLSPGLEIIYLQDGFNLSVADGLARAIELTSGE